MLLACAQKTADSPAPRSEAEEATPAIAADPLPEELAVRVEGYIDQFGRNWPSFRFHGAVLVARGDEVAMLQGFGQARLTEGVPNTPHTRFWLGTLSAPITAAMVLALVDRGELALTDSVRSHLPGFTHGDETTIEHLLGHRSGLESFTDSIMFAAWKRGPHTIDESMQIVASLRRTGTPGEEIDPSNSNYLVLGAIVEKVTGKPFARAARELVLEPAGMIATSYGDREDDARAIGMQFNEDEAIDVVTHVDPTAFGSAGGFVSTVEDLHRFLITVSGEEFLSEESRARLFGRTPEDPGFGFVPDIRFGRRVIRWPGLIDGFNGALEHYPFDGTTIVVLANSEVVPSATIADAIATVAFGGDVPEWVEPRAAPVALDTQLAAAGNYVITQSSLSELEAWADPSRVEQLLRLRVVHAEDALFLDVPGHGRRRMHPLSPQRFFFKDVAHTSAEVSRTADGTQRLSLRQGDGPEIRFISVPVAVARAERAG